MKYLDFYSKILNCKTEDDVFKYLIDNLKTGILLWSYFINWERRLLRIPRKLK